LSGAWLWKSDFEMNDPTLATVTSAGVKSKTRRHRCKRCKQHAGSAEEASCIEHVLGCSEFTADEKKFAAAEIKKKADESADKVKRAGATHATADTARREYNTMNPMDQYTRVIPVDRVDRFYFAAILIGLLLPFVTNTIIADCADGRGAPRHWPRAC
jgi:hypothetical protein